MNEQTHHDPQSHDTQSTDTPSTDPQPRHPEAPAAPSTDATASEQHDAAGASTPKRGRGLVKPILVGTGAAVVVLAVAGVGLTVAEAMDDDDDDPVATQSTEAGSGASSDDGDDEALLAGGAASSEPTDLVTAIEAALRAAGGGSATSIEVERDGWSVDVRLDDGSDVDVRVPEAGEPVVRADDDGDSSDDAPLDPARIADISEAAIAAAGGGSVLSIESEDDGRFEVELAQGGDEVDVELADDLTVIEVSR
ncbi:MAG: hypothetical protein ACQEWM_12705 [Actinomycetota bacterium]